MRSSLAAVRMERAATSATFIWHIDVVQGRLLGASTVARLHAEPAFRADLEEAKAELAAVRAQKLAPERDCAAEGAALAK